MQRGAPFLRRASGRQLQQRLGGLRREVVGQRKHRVLGGLLHVDEPLGRHAVGEKLDLGQVREQRLLRNRRLDLRYVGRDHDLLHPLADLDELRRPRGRVGLQLPTLGPGVGPVVVVHVAEQQALRRPMHDQPKVTTDPHRPEPMILGFGELVEAHSGTRRIELQVEGRGFRQ